MSRNLQNTFMYTAAANGKAANVTASTNCFFIPPPHGAANAHGIKRKKRTRSSHKTQRPLCHAQMQHHANMSSLRDVIALKWTRLRDCRQDNVYWGIVGWDRCVEIMLEVHGVVDGFHRHLRSLCVILARWKRRPFGNDVLRHILKFYAFSMHNNPARVNVVVLDPQPILFTTTNGFPAVRFDSMSKRAEARAAEFRFWLLRIHATALRTNDWTSIVDNNWKDYFHSAVSRLTNDQCFLRRFFCDLRDIFDTAMLFEFPHVSGVCLHAFPKTPAARAALMWLCVQTTMSSQNLALGLRQRVAKFVECKQLKRDLVDTMERVAYSYLCVYASEYVQRAWDIEIPPVPQPMVLRLL